MKTMTLVAALGLLCGVQVHAQTLYVSTTGLDTNPGTIDSPFATIPRAIGRASAGATIYVRRGTYAIDTTIDISLSGKKDTMCSLLSYPGERAKIDCSAMPVSGNNRGIRLRGSYWYIRGIDVLRAGDNGMLISGSYNIVEFCSFVGNNDTGLQLGGGAAGNRIINCDSYGNSDPGQGNADGFSPKLDVGDGNYFFGCRSWQNSDDGFDGYLRPSNDVTTTLENCWSFANGYLSDGNPSAGNGNGFKMGGSDSANLMHNMILKNCLAFGNRVKGFDQNHSRGSLTLLNCTAYGNGSWNFSVPETLATGKILTVKNCISVGSPGVTLRNPVLATDSWMSPFSQPSASDFLSLDTAGVRGPRRSDGTLPDVPFMHIAPGSQYVDAGTDVGLPFSGKAPDLGCFETLGTTSIASAPGVPSGFRLEQNFPNPFNPGTRIRFSVDRAGHATLIVRDIVGRRVAVLFDGTAAPGQYYEGMFDGRNLASGVYFCRLESGGRAEVRKLVLVR